MREEQWKDLVERYLIVKKVYIECEEIDVELKTNLQPLNEFRLTLDHIMRLISAELEQSYKFDSEYAKVKAHLCRAFYDISDMASRLYRNKIRDILLPYSPEEITMALPSYYCEDRIRIEAFSQEIVKLRNYKGTDGETELDHFFKYCDILDNLKEIYAKITGAICSLNEAHRNNLKIKKANQKADLKNGIICALAGVAGGAILGIIIKTYIFS